MASPSPPTAPLFPINSTVWNTLSSAANKPLIADFASLPLETQDAHRTALTQALECPSARPSEFAAIENFATILQSAAFNATHVWVAAHELPGSVLASCDISRADWEAFTGPMAAPAATLLVAGEVAASEVFAAGTQTEVLLELCVGAGHCSVSLHTNHMAMLRSFGEALAGSVRITPEATTGEDMLDVFLDGLEPNVHPDHWAAAAQMMIDRGAMWDPVTRCGERTANAIFAELTRKEIQEVRKEVDASADPAELRFKGSTFHTSEFLAVSGGRVVNYERWKTGQVIEYLKTCDINDNTIDVLGNAGFDGKQLAHPDMEQNLAALQLDILQPSKVIDAREQLMQRARIQRRVAGRLAVHAANLPGYHLRDVRYDDLNPTGEEVLPTLGSGCFSMVFRGELHGHQIAFKQPVETEPKDVEIARVEELCEILLLAMLDTLQSPHIVKLVGVCRDMPGSPGPCTTLLLYPNGTLEHYLEQRKPGDLVRMCTGIAEGLACMHSLDVLHADLHAGNVLLTSENVPVISDLGKSRKANGKWGGVVELRTLRLSPEVLRTRNRTKYSKASDVWMLGLLFLDLLRGSVSDPVEADIIAGGANSPPAVDLAIPATVERAFTVGSSEYDLFTKVVTGCLEYDPAHRWTVERVLDALKA